MTTSWEPTFPTETTTASYFLDDRIRDGQGERTAIITSAGSFTFKQAREQAYRAANVMKQHGVEIENRVLLLQNNCEELVFNYFGAHYLGAVPTMAVPFLNEDDL